MNQLNSQSLKYLCSFHSVSGNTAFVIAELSAMLKKLKIKPVITDYGLLVFGNLKNPKILISAHVDEVGFQVLKKNDDNTFLVGKSGHIDPVMLNNSPVYVQTKKGKISGTFYPKKELGDNKPEHFSEIILDTVDNKTIEIGDFGSYQREFWQKGDKIMATGLDNKVSVEMILELIQEFPRMLNSTMFSFVTEEETTYDCIAGLANLYKPQYGIVLDMMPVHQVSSTRVDVIPAVGKGPAILMAMHNYHLHPLIKEKLVKLKTNYQKIFVDIDFPPEPQNLQRNGVTKGINILLPMLGWHNHVYTMNTKDYLGIKKLIVELHEILNR
ncbi:hypothetical protein HY030_02420 [Candidatus Gottesmanbacteria bacterium]|nr:hypothetical protein [Candidatus Gottesmanbacteria bacterium]